MALFCTNLPSDSLVLQIKVKIIRGICIKRIYNEIFLIYMLKDNFFIKMKQPTMRTLLIAGALCLTIVSCVPARKFQETQAKQEQCAEDLRAEKAKSQDLEAENNELKSNMELANRTNGQLSKDTLVLGDALRRMRSQYDKINSLNDELLKKHALLQKGSMEANSKLMAELDQTRVDLQKKEDVLNKLEEELATKQANMDRLSTELVSREAKVNELEAMISKKDSTLNTLKQKVANALLSFQDQGLTVERKNGKIYISLEAKLLFASGSTKINKEGKDALLQLAEALKGQTELEIMVEGHTDTDKFKSNNPPIDNWDLSVLRATSVVRLLTEKGELEPTQVAAAGRGEFLPIDEEDKAKNRRIEIILTPKLGELFEIIDSTND
jgi:chemotaxis protein MotB